MKTMRSAISWCAVFALWALGALFLLKIWNYQKSLPDPLGSYIEFSIMFLITCYAFALLPMKHWLDWFFSRRGLADEMNRSSQ